MSESRTIEDNFVSGISNAIGISNTSNLVNTAKSLSTDLSTLKSQFTMLGIDATSIFTNEEQYTETLNAAGNAALKYLNSKIERLKNAWNTRVEVSIKSLVGEVSPYVTSPKEAAKALTSKMDNLYRYILGIDAQGSGSLLQDFGADAVNYLSNDPDLMNSLAGLGAVKTMANVFNIYYQTTAIIEKVLKIVEPLLPMLQIFTNIVLTYWSCGTSATEAAAEMTEVVEQEVQKLLSLALGAIRKYVYSIKIKVPALFLGALDSISVREAILSQDDTNNWLKAIFSEEFYNNTLYSLQWDNAINEAVYSTLGSYNDMVSEWENFNFVNANGEPILRGEFMQTKFMQTLTQKFLKNAVAIARKNASLINYSEISWSTYKEYSLCKEEFNESENNISSNSNTTELDVILEEDTYFSPISDLESIRLISKQLIANI